MKMKRILCAFLVILSTQLITIESIAQKLVTPNPTPEAVALYNYLSSISGKQTLTGQHNAPIEQSLQLSVLHRTTNQYPAVFGQDFGFSYPGYWDGINYRQRIVDEAITATNKDLSLL